MENSRKYTHVNSHTFTNECINSFNRKSWQICKNAATYICIIRIKDLSVLLIENRGKFAKLCQWKINVILIRTYRWIIWMALAGLALRTTGLNDRVRRSFPYFLFHRLLYLSPFRRFSLATDDGSRLSHSLALTTKYIDRETFPSALLADDPPTTINRKISRVPSLNIFPFFFVFFF